MMVGKITRTGSLGMALMALVGCTFALSSSSASALTAAPGWELVSRTFPTNLPPGGTGVIEIALYNVGGARSSGTIAVTDALPPGVSAIEAGELANQGGIEKSQWDCTGTSVVKCTNDPSGLPSVPVGEIVHIGIEVQVSPSASGSQTNAVTASGGGALASASIESQLSYDANPPGFGLAGLDTWFTDADGTPDTQAGSHPFEMTVVFGLNNRLSAFGAPVPVADVRNVEVGLPPGLIGDPGAVPKCTSKQFDEDGCSPASQIGTERAALGTFGGHPAEAHFPVYNIVPPPGIPARFGFDFNGIHVYLDAGVRSGSDYGLVEHVDHIPQRAIVYNTITIWGVPSDPSHDAERFGLGCEAGCSSTAAREPLLTLPTACSGAQTLTARVESWQAPTLYSERSVLTHDESSNPEGLTGCERLGFEPAISVSPDTSYADTPAGLSVEVRVSQEALKTPEGITAADIQNTQVTLPPGLVINPGQAVGLAACQEAESGVGTEGPAHCPSASKVGTDEISTPLLPDKLEGNVYVLQSDPPDLKLLVAASADGVFLKLVGDVRLDTTTGQLRTTFANTPELPFTVFKLAFSGGARAALATPTACGIDSSAADFTSWAAPFLADALVSSSFAIEHGPGGGACPGGTLPFSPTLTAGSTTDQAGGFTGFSMLLTRGDGQQRINGLRFTAPPGLTGVLSGVPLCTNAQADSNSCPEASQIGHTVVESGPGPYPLVVPEPGQPPAPIYLTEGYKGAPFGLSIVVPLHVGPFVLPTQRVRARIEVDPNTTQLTVTTDDLPQVVAGVPTDLRAVNAVIDRPSFMINPTNCEPREFSGTAYGAPPPGAGGATASSPIGSRFQVGACRALKFAPQFSVSTDAKASRSNGASLNVKLSFPRLPQGSQSNVRVVKVELPKQLPSRLTTLQKACTEAQFNANPAGCPAASVVGHAVAHTPIVPVPLTGPAYFVSHGSAKFPELVMVLQGYGLTIMLHGETFISKQGITSSTFHAVPDQPVSSFELDLPQGQYSALAAHLPNESHNLCGQKLTMPTEFVGQDGAQLRKSTPIAVKGCASAIMVTGSRVGGKTATIQVSVPTAGRLVATAKGLSKATKTAQRARTLTLRLSLTSGEAAALSKHAGRKLRAKVHLTFSPKGGKRLTTDTTVIVGR